MRLKSEIPSLQEENGRLKSKISSLREINERLKSEISSLRNKTKFTHDEPKKVEQGGKFQTLKSKIEKLVEIRAKLVLAEHSKKPSLRREKSN